MEWSEVRKKRGEMIEGMNKTLEGVKHVGLPYWVCATLMGPVFAGLILFEALILLWTLLKVWAGFLFKMLAAPFVVAHLFIDVVCISFWFLWLVVERMSGGRK